MTAQPLGPVLQSFFVNHLVTIRGLRPASVRSYRDVIRLLLAFVAGDRGCRLSRLGVEDLTFERILGFLRYLEEVRGNHARTRNQRLAVIHSFFEYLAGRGPDMLAICQRVAAIPSKRAAPPETHFLEREEISTLLKRLPTEGRHALRDRALVLFLYNTGARVQEVADLRVGHIHLGSHPHVQLHGKGDKWRTCPLWDETARQVGALLEQDSTSAAQAPIFASHAGRPLTRFGIYKIVRRHARLLEVDQGQRKTWHTSPHVLRHTTAVHLLEAGVEVNVIRGWLGHADLTTTNRYAEINARAKEAALRACEAPPGASEGFPRKPVWQTDEALLNWLASL
jgi:site-specific recombinase XerD